MMESTQSKLKARLLCVFALSAPIFYSWATPKIRAWGWGASEAWWVPWAHVVLILIALYQVAAPFVIVFKLHRIASRRAEHNLEYVALFMGVGGATAIAGLAFLLIVFGGGSIYPMYLWACVSLAAAVFWTLKYRRLLR